MSTKFVVMLRIDTWLKNLSVAAQQQLGARDRNALYQCAEEIVAELKPVETGASQKHPQEHPVV